MVAPFRLDSLLDQDEEAPVTDAPTPIARYVALDVAEAVEVAVEVPEAQPVLEPDVEPVYEPVYEPALELALMAPLESPIIVPSTPPPPLPPPRSRRSKSVQIPAQETVAAPVQARRLSDTYGEPRRRNRRRVSGRVVVVLAIVTIVAVAGLVVDRLHAQLPKATVTSALTSDVTVNTSAVTIPWPTEGEAAVSIPSVGFDMPSAAEQPVPIASLTKMMTAYVILHDHPLRLGQSGPKITITAADVADYDTDTVSDEANAQVALGEVLSEKELLGGMLIHSANDYAGALARWDAGSIPAFVAKMNSTALSLGMDHTHYADASGYDQSSQSTAGDLLKVAGPDMANSVFAGFVKMSSITLPVAGTVSTYTPLLGVQGVIGVKSGFTTVAGGCDVLAVMRHNHGKTFLVLAAVTGQTGPNVIDEAGLQALNLANATAIAVGQSEAIHSGQLVAHVAVAGHRVNASATSSANLLSWPGVTIHRTLTHLHTLRSGAASGAAVGWLIVEEGSQRIRIPVKLDQKLPKESILRRIL